MNLMRLLPWRRARRARVIGHLPVDAGCLLLIDPCYLRDVLFEGDERVDAWYENEVVAKIDGISDEHWPVQRPGDAPSALPLGRLVISGRGDGCYPVEALYADDGTLSEIRIRFDGLGA
jgi:hypothetical protein